MDMFRSPKFKEVPPFSSFFLEKQHFQTLKHETCFTYRTEKRPPFTCFLLTYVYTYISEWPPGFQNHSERLVVPLLKIEYAWDSPFKVESGTSPLAVSYAGLYSLVSWTENMSHINYNQKVAHVCWISILLFSYTGCAFNHRWLGTKE